MAVAATGLDEPPSKAAAESYRATMTWPVRAPVSKVRTTLLSADWAKAGAAVSSRAAAVAARRIMAAVLRVSSPKTGPFRWSDRDAPPGAPPCRLQVRAAAVRE